jgi:dTDP-4-amino-4,6-dideoxygalactose transaminase
MDLTAEYQEIRPRSILPCSVIHSGWYILGPELDGFEQEFAEFCGCKFAYGVVRPIPCTSHYGDWRRRATGDHRYTFIATALAITFTGQPYVVDIDPNTYTMDPGCLQAAITSRTKAIRPVHLYGQSADMEPVLELARQYHLAVIEDACQAHGALYQEAGSLGHLGCFSFYPTKNLGAYGDGERLSPIISLPSVCAP